MNGTTRRPREITGRTVLFALIGFFGFVFLVNAVMIKAATSTFGGVEVSSSYKAGLKFGRDVADARHQDALHWQVAGTLVRARSGEAVLDLTARDSSGTPLSGLAADIRLAHPADSRQDRVVAVREVAPGDFHGVVPANAGQWELVIDLTRGGERMFRSRSRVILK